MTPRVTVVLATRNGGRFVEEQLRSVLDQRGVDVRFLVADDASTDATVDLVRSVVPADRLELVVRRQPLGVPGTFLDLLSRVDVEQCDLVAFCDQDDVWHPDKLASAAAALGSLDARHPALWTCGYELVDAHGTPLGMVMPRHRYRPSFGNALVENLGPGCCMVWNRELHERLRLPRPAETVMHDVWLYLAATAVGTVVVDDRPLVRYRQHGGNAIGHGQTFAERLRQVRAVSSGALVSRETQAAAVLRCYGTALSADDRRAATVLATGSRAERFTLWRQRVLRRHARREDWLLVARLLVFRHPRR